MPDYDDDIGDAWYLYLDIMKGCERVTYEAIDSYQRVTDIKLNQWQIDMAIELDAMRRNSGTR